VPRTSRGRSGLHTYEGTIKWDAVFVCDRGRASPWVVPTEQSLMEAARAAVSESKKWAGHIAAHD